MLDSLPIVRCDMPGCDAWTPEDDQKGWIVTEDDADICPAHPSL